jgi:PilZ domain-containing protein
MATLTPQTNAPANDRRRTPRYPFVASAEVLERTSGTRMLARLTDISLYGCYLDMSNPLPSGSHVFVKIFRDTDFFEAEASVVYSQPNLGVGLAFREVKPHFLPILKKWLQGAMQRAMQVTCGLER